jgi:hypothetical protein
MLIDKKVLFKIIILENDGIPKQEKLSYKLNEESQKLYLQVNQM